MKTVILASAERDLVELRSYIVKNFSLATWQKSFGKLKESIRNLARFPHLGAIPEELEALHQSQYRQALSDMHRIIYEIRQDTIYIHIIADARRDMQSLLMRRLVR
ncbi:MAG: type II toxin-antitoxin system RelE/ParE family toxin [Rhodoferax sp.]|jgi:plasmid stabilization system protein ParE|uniref:type II toxin-antitoxin system RelE/ParE family toxin n=1 Tax=Rhodoferax sp. TaxID=50421 RepID=UPI003BB7C64E